MLYSILFIHGNLFSDNQLGKLKDELKTSRKKAYAESTSKNLKIQWEAYLLFCFYFKLASLPASTETLSLYMLNF